MKVHIIKVKGCVSQRLILRPFPSSSKVSPLKPSGPLPPHPFPTLNPSALLRKLELYHLIPPRLEVYHVIPPRVSVGRQCFLDLLHSCTDRTFQAKGTFEQQTCLRSQTRGHPERWESSRLPAETLACLRWEEGDTSFPLP